MTRGKHVSDDDLVAAVRAAAEAGETDPAEGGVAPDTVADRIALAESTAQDRMRELAKEGRLRRVRGLNPETGSPRTGYLPATTGKAEDS